MLDKNTSYTSYIFLILVNMSSAKISFFAKSSILILYEAKFEESLPK